MNIEATTEFLGWCTVINVGLLVLAAFAMMTMRRFMIKVHSTMFNLSEENLSRAYFQYLAMYKIAIIVFNLVPYIALKVMA